MSRYSSHRVSRSFRVAAFLFFAVAMKCAFAGETAIDPTIDAYDASDPAKNLARMNCGATIDLIGPDGRAVVVANKGSSASALLFDDDTLNYPLSEGDATFIVSFPRISVLDRFTFVNENAAAAGEIKIAVSTYRLSANTSKCMDGNGRSSVTGNRQFDL